MSDWARYMYENPDVYDMFSDGGKWTWANGGRQQNAYMRQDGTPLQAATAAEYAQQHYRNFGKREGRKVHEGNGTDYASKLSYGRSGSGGGGLNPEVEALQKLVMSLTESLGEAPTAEQVKEVADAGAGVQGTVLTNNYLQDDDKKKKKSFLQPIA